jgi:predicted nuclease of predicted toxin-antitoxin system
MNILADENISQLLVERLRQEGHQVLFIAEIASGSDDHAVLEIANQQRSLLVTDDKDFGEMVFHRHLQASGVLLVRLAILSPAQEMEVVAQVIRTYGNRLLQAFTVITPQGIRTRPIQAH